METKWRSEVLGVMGWDGRNTGEELILSRTIPLGPDGRRNDGHRWRRAWRGNPGDGWSSHHLLNLREGKREGVQGPTK